MEIRPKIRFALAGAWLVATSPQAEDIDLYMGNPNALSAPNVLIILDNTANWSQNTKWEAYGECGAKDTKFCYERAVLKEVLDEMRNDPEPADVNVGVMLFSESGQVQDNPAPSGGYVRYAIRSMAVNGNLDDLYTLVTSLNEGNDKGSAAEYALAMHEAYLYYQGDDARGGIKLKADHGQQYPTVGEDDRGAFDVFELGDATGNYAKPATGACATNYIIFISNGAPDNGENTTAAGLLSGLGGRLPTDPIRLDPDTRQTIWADEYARFLASEGTVARPHTPIHTHVIDVAPETTGQGPANTALLKSMSEGQGKGIYYSAKDASQLKRALLASLREIQAVNSVVASVALPVSINVRGTHLNQVYMGVFRPDTAPRWFGNLKLYELGVNVSDELFLADRNGRPAQSADTGFIANSVESFWTQTSTYWDFRCSAAQLAVMSAEDKATLCGTPPSVSDMPDGPVVEKGAAGQRLREALPSQVPDRRLYTCPAGVTCTAAAVLGATPEETLFYSGNTHITAADLGIAGDPDADETIAARSDLMAWIRGWDNTSPPERAADGARPSIVGDVLHSRPVVVNYNRLASGCSDTTNNDTDVVTYYAANDGIIHAIKGGKDDVFGSGRELWGFVPMEGFSKLKRLRDNTPGITLPSPVPAGANNKPYFMDGNLTIYALDTDGNCKLEAGTDVVYLFATARRGGRFIYAFDVTDPISPRVLWKKDASSEGFSELGQTWSDLKPTAIYETVNGEPARVPVVVFGAGYDPAAEDRPYNTSTETYGSPEATSPSMGRGVFVLEAATGNILRRFGPAAADGGMTHSVPSAVTVLTDNSGTARLGYVGDTGGNLWRIDFDGEPAAWTITKFAELAGTGEHARKFLYPPDAVALESGGYAILIGSGDREHPFDTTTRNRFYMVRDALNITYPARCTGNASATCELFDATTNSTIPNTDKGWYMDLGVGEKVVGGAVTLAGTTFFPTNEWTPPAPGSCTSELGIARIYGISYLNASATMYFNGSTETTRSMEVPGGGFPPSPVPTLIEIDDQFYQGVISGPTVVTPPGLALDKRKLIYWYRQGVD